MTPAPTSKALIAGLAVAIVFALVCLTFALWNPAAALVPGIVFVLAAFGITKRSRWSAYGAALFILALAAAALTGLAKRGIQGREWLEIDLGIVLFGLAAWLLFHAGRSMPAAVASGIRWIWVAMAAIVFFAPQVMSAFVISAGSMENTLLTGDQILVGPAASSPSRGELVIFRYPVNPNLIFIKRVVAEGGDKVRLQNKQLIVNGMSVSEPYVVHSSRSLDAFRDNFPSEPNTPLPASWAQELPQDTVNGELVVPAGKFFVLGDNRDNSLDSRYWGFLDAKDLVGKPMIVYFSAAETTAQAINAPFGGPPVLLHPSMIRWGRMFKGL